MEKRDDTLRLGIIGCGNAAERWHLPALRQLADVRLVAAADIDPARVRRVGEKFDIEQQFTDYRVMLDRADIQAIAIITPTQAHAEPAMAAIAAGKSVLIDKPLAMTPAECDRLIAAAASSPGKVMVGFNLRWHRLVQRAHAIIESGALGEIKAVTGVYSHWHPGEKAQVWHKRRETGGGILFNEGVHHFDLWRSLLGTEVADIYAVSRPSEHFEDETSTIVARMTDGNSGSSFAGQLFKFDQLTFDCGDLAHIVEEHIARRCRHTRLLCQRQTDAVIGGQAVDKQQAPPMQFGHQHLHSGRIGRELASHMVVDAGNIRH